MKTLLLILCVSLLTISFAQGQDQIDTITISVEPYKHATNGAFYTFLGLTCSDPTIEHIDGFDFEWGYNYTLKLKQTKLAQPLEDAGDRDYELINVLSKTEVEDSTTFKMVLTGWVQLAPNAKEDDAAFTFNTDGSCTYLGELTFKYSPTFKSELKALNKSNDYKRCTFLFLKGEIYLIAL